MMTAYHYRPAKGGDNFKTIGSSLVRLTTKFLGMKKDSYDKMAVCEMCPKLQ